MDSRSSPGPCKKPRSPAIRALVSGFKSTPDYTIATYAGTERLCRFVWLHAGAVAVPRRPLLPGRLSDDSDPDCDVRGRQHHSRFDRGEGGDSLFFTRS